MDCVKMPHLFIYHAHVTSVPHIIGTSVRDLYILVYTSATRFVYIYMYNVQRPNAIFLLRDLVLAMVCVKKNFPLHATVTRSRHGDRHQIHGYKHDRLEGRLLPRKVVR